MRITHIVETQRHADHVSGALRLAAVTGAPVFVHEAADVGFAHIDVADDEDHDLGTVRMTLLETPGHAPDGLSLVVVDRTRAPEPWFVLTGNALFAGGVGRPDGLADETGVVLAEQLYESLWTKLLTLPDHVEVYPAHFGAAGCGTKRIGKLGSTIGFERRFNPALQLTSKADFVRFVLADLPPSPAGTSTTSRSPLRAVSPA
jgi:glyoxylase-like metal-dependent hydrolase (beta-lactamase superfamily II)